MSDQEGPTVEGFGEYHPEAAAHQPYSDSMAAWRNQVKAMQAAGTLPQTAVAAPEMSQEPAEESNGGQPDSEQEERSQERQEAAEDSEGGNPSEDDQDSGGGPREVFDPAEHNAPEVLEYLKGCGEDEARRVLESEEAGKARKGILNLKDDVLAKARENDETGSGSKSA